MTWSAWGVAVLLAAAVLMLPTRIGTDVGSADLRDATFGDTELQQAEHEHAEVERSNLRGADLRDAGARDADEVAAAMALLALAYRTGLPTWQVLTAVAQTSADPVAADLRQVATALQWGASEAVAWASVGPAWAPAARVVSLAHAGGVPPGPLLTAASDDLHRAELDRLEVAAAQVGVRLVAPLGLVLLPAFCLTTVVPLVVALGSQLLVG
ncbi:type II secretion system F family protein [Humibacillus xanthopallidus]|uniref:Type II secretion system (T2SS) protein F n=1 Tax=Humibacillus xanthopallidus TaxID=412689 RepID=A0A543I1P4_9MICO|nr:type II secretion system F family protein [Humibacillus xanthopallidus]TQM64513.1 type II secretion system (T2SS) protein F [Humibacillus xanthopallidus]